MTNNASEALAALRKQFQDELDGRIKAIRSAFDRLRSSAWVADEAQALHRLVHSLTGSAGTFGMNSVSEVSRQLETAIAAVISTGQPPDVAGWQSLIQVLDRLEGIAHIRLHSNAPSMAPKPAAFPQPQRSPLIHLVEDDPTQAEFMRQRLVAHGYRVRHFADPADFSAVISAKFDEMPAAVVMDMMFPEGDSAGANIIASLGLGANAGIPVVFVSVRDEITARLTAFRAGASRYLAKPVDTEQLCSLLDDLTGRMPPDPFRVLLVDDDNAVLAFHETVLRHAGLEVLAVSTPLKVLEKLDQFAPDVVVLDVYMPDASGPELAAVIREQGRYMNLPILFLSAESDMTKQLFALNLGGDDFLVKPVSPDHLVSAVIARARRARQNTETMRRLNISLYEREREHLALDQHALVSGTDVAGRITYANDNFCRVSGYALEELLGQNHNMLKSGRHSPEFYRDMWTTLKSGNIWRGEICNRKKDGGFYWVSATITPFLDSNGEVYQYVSIRSDITAIKENQESLRLSKERLRRGQLFANIGTWEWSIQTGDLFWSERIAPLFGYPAGDLETSYENFLNAVHPDDRQAVIDAVNACVERDAPYNIEHRVVWPDGTVRWLLERGAVVRDAEGKAVQMIGVVQDIDDRKRAEIALAERERQLREAQQLASLGNWTADLISGELMWSEEIFRIFGHEPGSFLPSVAAFHAAVHPDDRVLVQESEKRAEQTGRHDVVHRIVRPDGTVRHVHELARFETDAAGKLIRLTGTVQDVTERRLAEQALQESQQKLSGLFELSPLGIALADMNGNYLEFNEAFRAICGYPAGELRNLDYWTLTPREYEAQEAAQLELLNRTGRYGPYEKQYRQKDGTLVPIRLNGILVKDRAGRPRIWSIIEDITDHRQAESALIAAREEADRANQAKSEFLSSMSHELRTPMNAILGFSQILQYDDALSAENRDSVDEIFRAGQHLLELINEVLDLAKVESGHIDLSLEPVEICSVIRECLSLMTPLAKNGDIQLSHSGLDGAVVRADRTRLRQVLLNLISNAIKYNRQGGSVRIEARQMGDQRLRLLVTDTGPGIPAERMAELFQPFNRLGAEGSTIEGTGIGLTITRRIAEMMGGTVDAESEPGRGSTFWIELPMEDGDDGTDEPQQKVGAGDTALPAAAGHSHTVLYIEDNPSNITLMAQVLGRRPHIHLLTAHTPRLGIDFALSRHPEVILLDINMPEMDGYQVLAALRAEASLKDIPVIAVTANAMPRDIKRGMAAGFADYLTKPLDISRLYDLLDRLFAANAETRP